MTVSRYGSLMTDLAVSQRRWDEAADRVVRSATGDETVDLADAAVGMMAARRGYEATFAVVRAKDRMLGTLIDMLA